MSVVETNILSIAKRNKRPLILDGAMGSLLQQKGFNSRGLSWMTYVNTESPETIISIHKEYINAGADVITTNTFRTNPLVTGSISNCKDEVKIAVSLAKSAVDDHPILIAGSNAPAEDCYQKERTVSYNKLQENHSYHIDFLKDNGVDFILNETQSHFDEIEIICKHCERNSILFVVSLYVDNDMRILSGEKIEKVIGFIREHNPLAIGINCVSPGVFLKIMNIVDTDNINFGFYLNCINGSQEDLKIECGISPAEYGNIIKEYLQLRPSFIGACCGSSPEHIQEIKKIIDG